MSHFIEWNQLKSTHSFFSVQQPAWHNLGVVVDKAQTSAQAIKLANLDFEVAYADVKAEIITDEDIKNGTLVPHDELIPNTKAIYRKDTGHILTKDANLVTDKYEIFQNWEAFDFIDSLIQKGEAVYHTAGVLFNGEVIFMTAKLPQSVFIKGHDRIDQYLLLTTRHDGLGSIRVKFTPIRVVCNNTLMSALSSGNSIIVRHTKSLQNKLADATKVLGLIRNQTTSIASIFERMSNIKIEQYELEQYLAKLLLGEKDYTINPETKGVLLIHNEISTQKLNVFTKAVNYTYFGAGQNLDTCANTIFGAQNIVTGLIQNTTKDTVKAEDKFMSLEFGGNNRLIDKAYKLALELLEKYDKHI